MGYLLWRLFKISGCIVIGVSLLFACAPTPTTMPTLTPSLTSTITPTIPPTPTLTTTPTITPTSTNTPNLMPTLDAAQANRSTAKSLTLELGYHTPYLEATFDHVEKGEWDVNGEKKPALWGVKKDGKKILMGMEMEVVTGVKEEANGKKTEVKEKKMRQAAEWIDPVTKQQFTVYYNPPEWDGLQKHISLNAETAGETFFKTNLLDAIAKQKSTTVENLLKSLQMTKGEISFFRPVRAVAADGTDWWVKWPESEILKVNLKKPVEIRLGLSSEEDYEVFGMAIFPENLEERVPKAYVNNYPFVRGLVWSDEKDKHLTVGAWGLINILMPKKNEDWIEKRDLPWIIRLSAYPLAVASVIGNRSAQYDWRQFYSAVSISNVSPSYVGAMKMFDIGKADR